MESYDQIQQLPQALLSWYYANRRELPWRQDKDPYHIWVSEIMLQQTRVEAVKGYYTRFLQALPTVESLADADDEALHKLWEGLGYYSRVRNLKKAAQVVMESYGGEFPKEYDKVLALPGIGEYTAGAICSIAFNQKVAAVDGNVLRVICRLRNDSTPIDSAALKKEIKAQLEQVYPEAAGDFTQALMELGATICGPNRKPDCENCPCKGFCEGYRLGTAGELPVKRPKAKRRQEDMTVLILSCQGRYALRKRPDRGLLAGLWEFPNVSGKLDAEAAIIAVEQTGMIPKEIYRQVEKKHIFTHVQWDMCGVYMEVREPAEPFAWLTAEEVNAQAALPTAFRQFWEEVGYV